MDSKSDSLFRKLSIIALIVGLLFRIFMYYVGSILDTTNEKYSNVPSYTDIDYHVFSDSSKSMLLGFSPYERSTFRYPPLLSFILIPNHLVSPDFGKMIFITADVVIIRILYILISLHVHHPRKLDQIHNNLLSQNIRNRVAITLAFAWAINPISANICTRGSSDSISNVAILYFVYCISERKILLGGGVLGFLIYWRIYPIIYIPSILTYLYIQPNYIPKNGLDLTLKIVTILKFLIMMTFVFGVLAYSSYYLYGNDYLENSIFYHVGRMDHRHNFSVYFYWIYLHLSSPDATENLLKNWALKILPVLPQILLNLGLCTSLFFKKISLHSCIMLITMVFVTYNKVITAQYFTWYLCLLPLVISEIMFSCIISPFPRNKMKSAINFLFFSVLLWIVTLLSWLYVAYLLEFEGIDTFLWIWFHCLSFHIANVLCIVSLYNILTIQNKSDCVKNE